MSLIRQCGIAPICCSVVFLKRDRSMEAPQQPADMLYLFRGEEPTKLPSRLTALL
jgi:hypothetical protein